MTSNFQKFKYPIITALLLASVLTIETWYNQTNNVLRVLSVCLIVGIVVYGLLNNNPAPVTVKRRITAYLLGFIVIAIGFVAYIIISGRAPFAHLYRTMPIQTIIYNILVAPIIEEVTYRQTFYHDWLKPINPWVGRIVVGSIFILSHAITTPIILVFYIPAVVALFIAYEYSGDDVRVSIILHITNNITAIL